MIAAIPDPWQPTDTDADLQAGINISPYVHWWKYRNAGQACGVEICTLPRINALQRDAQTAYFQQCCAKPTKMPDAAFETVNPDAANLFGETVTLPGFALAPAGTVTATPDNLADRTDPLPRDTVITGIVDEAIALGHGRFRNADNTSRFLAAWQQGARFVKPANGAKSSVPFGNMLLQHDINDHFDDASHDGWLDEDAFNIAAGLTDGSEAMGVTTLERTVGHGSHVLDLAAGFDAGSITPDNLKRRPVLAVTLPRREAIGMAGTFLQFFVLHAMEWIVDMADALWAQHYPNEEGGFPIVINLSFGQHAGPKNGTTLIEKAFRIMAASRPAKAPLRLVMPVGNDNMERGNAYVSCDARTAAAVLDIPLRIQPQDQSSNFVELWVEVDGAQPDLPHPLILDIDLPDGQSVKDLQGHDRHFTDLPGGARLYAETVSRADLDAPEATRKTLYHYVLCVSPTQDDAGDNPISPAGIWRLRARWDPQGLNTEKDAKAALYCTIQVDQAAENGSLRNRRAYLDHPQYRSFDDDGRPRDTFRYPYKGQPGDLLDGDEPSDLVQRRGTHNAIGTDAGIIRVGGYRQSDGRPADYSATNHATGRTPYGASAMMTASLPTETAPAHAGLRAAGTRSAATVSLSGTSFAAGLATRQVVDELLKWQDDNCAPNGHDGSAASIAARASLSEQHGIYPDAAHVLKVGSGRLSATSLRDVERLTWGG